MNHRRDKLNPNADRSFDEAGQDPASIRPLAATLLSDVAYASTIISPVTAKALASLPSDIEIAELDEEAGNIMHVNAIVQTVTVKDSVIAPAVKWIAEQRDTRIKTNYSQRSKEIGNNRPSRKDRLTWQDTEQEWPEIGGRPMSPIEIHLAYDTDYRVDLTPYQIQASGLIEMVRGCGKVIGNCNGDQLADDFMRIILALSGKENRGANRKFGAEMLGGGFLQKAERTETEWWHPISGHDELLAITVLGAWIRMARLGVPLFSHENLEAWPRFFDGALYDADCQLLGKIWSHKHQKDRLYERSSLWLSRQDKPWMVDSSGSPIVPYGLVGEILRLAITKVQIIGLVSDEFALTEHDADPSFVQSNKILVQLKRFYNDIAGGSLGSIISTDLEVV